MSLPRRDVAKLREFIRMKYVERRWARTDERAHPTREGVARTSSKGLLNISIGNPSSTGPQASFSAKLSSPPPPALDFLDLTPATSTKTHSHDSFAGQDSQAGFFDAFAGSSFSAPPAGPSSASVFDAFHPTPGGPSPHPAPHAGGFSSNSNGQQSGPPAPPKKDFSVFDELMPPQMSHPPHGSMPQPNPFLGPGPALGGPPFAGPFANQQLGYSQGSTILPTQHSAFPPHGSFAPYPQQAHGGQAYGGQGGGASVPPISTPHQAPFQSSQPPNPFLVHEDHGFGHRADAPPNFLGDEHAGVSDAVNPFDLF